MLTAFARHMLTFCVLFGVLLILGDHWDIPRAFSAFGGVALGLGLAYAVFEGDE